MTRQEGLAAVTRTSSEGSVRRVFLDIGAHTGETLRAVMDPRYRFDRIYCFEPVAACVQRMRRMRRRNVTLCPFGLWNETIRMPVYSAKTVGASVFRDKVDLPDRRPVQCNFVRASDWFRRNLRDGDEVYAKLNCEGSEATILQDLLDSGELSKVSRMLVHFDIRLIPSERHREQSLISAIAALPQPVLQVFDDLPRGVTLAHTMRLWLDSLGVADALGPSPTDRLRSRWAGFRYVTLPELAQQANLGIRARRWLPHSTYEHARGIWARILGGDRQ